MSQPVRPHAALDYADWKAPSDDGHYLIWPEPATLIEQTLDNQHRLNRCEDVRVQNTPLPELRRRMRQFLGHRHDQPLIVTGHQTELYHPGVWVKNVVIDALAQRLGGRAIHFGVDTDHPKHLVLRWPGGGEPITDDQLLNQAAWSGLLRPPSPAHLRKLRQSLDNAASEWSFTPSAGPVLEVLEDSTDGSTGLSQALLNAHHHLDWMLGLRHDATVASPLWGCEIYLIFVHHLLSHADRLAEVYNHCLQEYRVQAGISGNRRPMPDLTCSEEAVEIPFWLDDLSGGVRSRPSVFRTEGGWTLSLLDGHDFTFDPSADAQQAVGTLRGFLAQAKHRLSPRALTLTMFIRLFVADQFVHGIGGGRYDQVTDRIIDGFFGITPPRFAVATATLLFPDAVGQPRVCVSCIIQEGHRLRHSLLGKHKWAILERIGQSPRKSPERQTAFLQMHQALRQAESSNTAMKQWRQRLQEAMKRERFEKTLFDRELPCILQPVDRLERLIDRITRDLTEA